MSCFEVKELLDDYLDNLLKPEIKNSVQFHLEKCEECQHQLRLLKNLFIKIKELPLINLPQDLCDEIKNKVNNINIESQKKKTKYPLNRLKKTEEEKSLLKKRKVITQTHEFIKKQTDERDVHSETIREKKFKRKKLLNRLIIFLMMIIVIAACFIFYFNSLNSEPWKLESSCGTYLINGQTSFNKEFFLNDIITTEEFSDVKIVINQTSEINLMQQSEIQIIGVKKNGLKVKVNYGSIYVSTFKDNPNLFIETEKFSIKDFGSKYKIEIDSTFNYKVEVDFNLIEIIINNSSIPLKENYKVELRNGFNIGTPFHKNSSQLLQDELFKFDYENGGKTSLEKILNEAKETDALSLFIMLKKISEKDRFIIYKKISSYYPLPKDVKQIGIISLNNEMLKKWWDEIEWQL